MIPLELHLFKGILIDERRPCVQRQASTMKEVLTNESLMRLDYAQHSCMHSKTLIFKVFFKVRIERERPCTCLRRL